MLEPPTPMAVGLCFAATSVVATVIGGPVVADGVEFDPANYNTLLGTQTINPAYRFTEQSALLETAKGIRAMGSNIFKINLKAGRYSGLEGEPSRLDDLTRWGDFKKVLDMDFAHYFFWAYSDEQVAWNFGDYTDAEQDMDYREFYDLTTHLLTEYDGSGKTFYLGHWEGDWHLLKGEGYDANPDPQRVDQMAQWYNVRQRAIDDAKADLAGAVSHVDVFQYAEVNHVAKAIDQPELRSVTNDVLPRSNVDYVSWSAWEMMNSAEYDEIAERVATGLSHLESMLPEKDGLPTTRRAFFGELGWNINNANIGGSEAERERYMREAMRAAIEFGAPFVLYWQFYDNSMHNGEDRAFWLIDDAGNKTPLYWTMHNYNALSRDFLERYLAEHGTMPGAEVFRAFALEALSRVPSDGPIAVPEPTAASLLMLGCGFLMPRRRCGRAAAIDQRPPVGDPRRCPAAFVYPLRLCIETSP